MVVRSKTVHPTTEAAETLALTALAFLAGDPARLVRFLNLTGFSAETLRQSAAEPATLASVLEYLLADEPLLLVFAADHGLDPTDVSRAQMVLGGSTPTND